MPLKVVKGRHGSPNLYLRGTVRRIRVDESTGTSSPSKAEEIRTRREVELLEQSIHGRRAVATFASAALSYMRQGGESRYLRPLLVYFGQEKLSAIDQAAIERCAALLKPGAATSTINRQVHTPISSVLKHAAARGCCEFRPIERPKQPKGKTRWLTFEEAGRLISSASVHSAPLLTFMLYTGARVAEAVYLQWDQVNLTRRHVVFLDTKNGTDRGVPLHPMALAALANLPHRRGAVFRKPDGRSYPLKPEGGGQIKKAFAGACRRAGIKGATPHTLRHTWATWHYQEHRDLARLMELGGWKTLAMVQRYAHVNSEHNSASINALPSVEVGRKMGSGQIREENWRAKTMRLA
jgi:integrase